VLRSERYGHVCVGLLVLTLVSFLVGFRLHGGIADGLIAFALIIVFSFAFEWVFITFGLFASNAQAAQGLAFLMVPLTFVSSAYVTVSSCRAGFRPSPLISRSPT
jgi:ABC-2 type transport system permease protein